jgi:hypothetical protein
MSRTLHLFLHLAQIPVATAYFGMKAYGVVDVWITYS